MNRHMAREAPLPVDPALIETVRQSVLAQSGPVTELRVAAAVRDSGRLLGAAGSLAAMDRISAELNGLGPLQNLVRDPDITDIFVNAPDEVWLDRGSGPERANVAFENEASLRALAVRLIASGGRRLDDGSPCVDVKLDAGYRVHAVLPPISATGTLISIRIKRQEAFSLAELQESGCIPAVMATILATMVAARLSFLISGATGAGKTTLLSSLLGLCDPAERLVLIEDAAELDPDHPHAVTLEARHANTEGTGGIDLAELVRQALRMNPGRLIVGECRGAEVRELLMALNTGHSGGGGTIHANSAADVPARLAALGALAGLSNHAVALQASSALDAVIHVDRRAGRRFIAQIGLVRADDDGIRVVPAVLVGPPPDEKGPLRVGRGPGWEDLAARLGLDAGLVPSGGAPLRGTTSVPGGPAEAA